LKQECGREFLESGGTQRAPRVQKPQRMKIYDEPSDKS